MEESQHCDKKSLRALDHISELAKDAVGFANALGGNLIIGIEDHQDAPSPEQRIDEETASKLQKRLAELTINVSYVVEKRTHPNGGEYLSVQIVRNQIIPASTTSGIYMMRSGDKTFPLRPEDLGRFMTDRSTFNWELTKTQEPSGQHDATLLATFLQRIRASERVTTFVKQKTDLEMIHHYGFVREGCLTNLGLLCIGTREQRALLNTAPIIQCIKYNARGEKVQKWLWDNYLLAPWQMVDVIWEAIPEWKESYELPDGLFRKHIPLYDEVVIRELLVNALVHRPYTQRGDIFINLHPDRMEIHNPGSLPLGVTPQNILHSTSKRNEGLAQIFHDLQLMEREGSGYDKIYETLLMNGKALPVIIDNGQRVTVTIYPKILDTKIIDFVARADEAYQLTQKERITLGLLAQNKALNVMELTRALELDSAIALESWLGKLEKYGLLNTQGRTRGKTYSLEPEIFRNLKFKGKTTLGNIEDHRLRELIFMDIKTYSNTSISEIHDRIGREIPKPRVKKALKHLIQENRIALEGIKRGAHYHINPE